jgi:GT2 family glycosyltransferase
MAGLKRLVLREGDEIIVADNTPGASARAAAPRRGARERPRIRLLAAQGRRSPGFARNRGAAAAAGEWLVFIDADTIPSPSLLDDFFKPPPDAAIALLAGGIVDVAARPTIVARHGVARRRLDQQMTLHRAHHPYAQSANCAVRREAFGAVQGFAAGVRAGEDADLCLRLAEAGWSLEERPDALVAHRSRETLLALLGQLARHGSGAAWLNRRYPRSFPPPSPVELARRLGHDLRAAFAALVRGNSCGAAFALLDLAGACAFELGRLLPNRARGA